MNWTIFSGSTRNFAHCYLARTRCCSHLAKIATMKRSQLIEDLPRDIEQTVFAAEVSRPLRELNMLFLEMMIESASDVSANARPTLVTALTHELQRLTAAARERLASCPVALLDLGFGEQPWSAASVSKRPYRTAAVSGEFGKIAAIRVASATLTLGWTLARWRTEVACIVFGMSESAIHQVSALGGPQSIHQWAEANSHRVRPRWEEQPRIWWKLLRIALEGPHGRLPPLSMYVLRRQLADLVSMEGARSAIAKHD